MTHGGHLSLLNFESSSWLSGSTWCNLGPNHTISSLNADYLRKTFISRNSAFPATGHCILSTATMSSRFCAKRKQEEQRISPGSQETEVSRPHCHRVIEVRWATPVCRTGSRRDEPGDSRLFRESDSIQTPIPSFPTPLGFARFIMRVTESGSHRITAYVLHELIACIFALVPQADGKWAEGILQVGTQ